MRDDASSYSTILASKFVVREGEEKRIHDEKMKIFTRLGSPTLEIISIS